MIDDNNDDRIIQIIPCTEPMDAIFEGKDGSLTARAVVCLGLYATGIVVPVVYMQHGEMVSAFEFDDFAGVALREREGWRRLSGTDKKTVKRALKK